MFILNLMMQNNTNTEHKIITKEIYASDVYLCFSQVLKNNMMAFFDDIKEITTSHINNEELESLDIHKLNILSSYLRTVKNIFIQFGHNHYNYFDEKITNINPSANKFSNIDRDEINEKQLQNSLIHKYEKENIPLLLQFKQQLSLLYQQPIDSYKLSISPFVAVSTFAKSIRLLQLSYENKIILYKSFEKTVLTQLKPTYTNILKNHFKQNFHTEIKIKPKKPEQSAIIESINKNTYSIKHIYQTLDIIQNNLSLKDPLQIKNAFLEQLKNNHTGQMQQSDKDNLNLVTLLFQQIQSNKFIELSIKETLMRLQVVYIRFSFSDKNLLHNHQHPAKLLLNEITENSEKWLPKQDPDNVYFKKLKSFVNSIINSTTFDKNLFEEKSQLFIKLIKQCQPLLEPKTPKNNADEGRNKIITAMKTIDALLNHKTEEFDTPDYIEKILRTPWKNLLVLLLVRHSNSSNEYLRMINFIDELFALLVPIEVTELMQESIASVCQTYENGLKLIAYQESEIFEQSKGLKSFIVNHQKKLSKKTDKSFRNEIITRIHSKISLFNKSSKSFKSNQDIQSTNINKFLMDLSNADKQLVRPISYGKWLEFKHSNGKTIQAKLSWINPKTGRYLFVNTSGLKITDKSAQQLADGIRENEIVIKS